MNWPWCERRSSSSLQEIDLFAIAESIHFVANFVAQLFGNTELACFDKVQDKVEDKVQDKVEDKVQDKVEDKVQDKVEDKVQDKVEDKVQDKVEDKVRDKVEDKVLRVFRPTHP